MALAETFIKLIKNEIKTLVLNSSSYPSVDEMTCDSVPSPLLDQLIKGFFKDPAQQMMWKQSMIKAVRPRSGPMPFLMGISVQLAHKFNSKWLVNRLYNLGVCESYQELLRYKWSYLGARRRIEAASSNEVTIVFTPSVPSPISEVDGTPEAPSEDDSEDNESEISFDLEETYSPPIAIAANLPECQQQGGEVCVQHIADNVDINMSCKYGHTSFHAVGRAKVTTPDQGATSESFDIPRVTTTARSVRCDILNDLEVKIRSYTP